MNKESKAQSWTGRIVNATPGDLIGITYELILDTLKQAKSHLEVLNQKEFERSIDKASKFLRELMESLDMSFEISLDLMSLYLYMNKLMVTAVMKQSEKPLIEAEKLLNTLLSAWNEVAAGEDKTKGPVMENAQRVFAGLTYGKGTLNESILDNGNNKRGFKA